MSFLSRTTLLPARPRALPMLAAAAVLGLAFFPAGVVAQATLPLSLIHI